MILFKRLNEAWNEFPQAYSSFYKVGPFTMEISFHSEFLAEILTRAFAHLCIEKSLPNLTIRLWPEKKLPPLDWNLIKNNGYRGYSEHSFYFHYFETIDALSVIDTESGIAYYAVRDPKALPWWVRGSPLQVILHVWLRENGIQLTHSACISNGNKGVLLTGKGGSGKSTMVLACLEDGFFTLGEDYVLIGPDDVYSIYQTAKLMPHTRVLFPSYESSIMNPDIADKEKALIHYLDLFPQRIIFSTQVHVVVSLEIGEKAYMQKSCCNKSLQSMLLTTVMQLPHANSKTTSLIFNKINKLDHYHLRLGPDMQENVSLVKELLK